MGSNKILQISELIVQDMIAYIHVHFNFLPKIGLLWLKTDFTMSVQLPESDPISSAQNSDLFIEL